MIKSVNYYHIYDLLKKDANFYYEIPKFQRATQISLDVL